jgi:hypothetical protein
MHSSIILILVSLFPSCICQLAEGFSMRQDGLLRGVFSWFILVRIERRYPGPYVVPLAKIPQAHV